MLFEDRSSSGHVYGNEFERSAFLPRGQRNVSMNISPTTAISTVSVWFLPCFDIASPGCGFFSDFDMACIAVFA